MDGSTASVSPVAQAARDMSTRFGQLFSEAGKTLQGFGKLIEIIDECRREAVLERNGYRD